MTNEWAGVLLVTPDNELIVMHRDDKAGIRDPGRYGIFGGKVEQRETPMEAALREIREETNVHASERELEPFKTYEQERDYLPGKSILHTYVIRDVDPKQLRIFEGQGFTVLKDRDNPNLAQDVREVFADWFNANE